MASRRTADTDEAATGKTAGQDSPDGDPRPPPAAAASPEKDAAAASPQEGGNTDGDVDDDPDENTAKKKKYRCCNGCRTFLGQCATSKDYVQRIKDDLQDCGGPVEAWTHMSEVFQQFVALIAMVGLGVSFLVTWVFSGNMAFTYGQPYPMFVEGACLCNGTLCDDVLFTFDLQLPPSVNASEYWQMWRETVWWDLDGYQSPSNEWMNPGGLVGFTVDPDPDDSGTADRDWMAVDLDQAATRATLFEDVKAGSALVFTATTEKFSGTPCADLGDLPWEQTQDDEPWQASGNQCTRNLALVVRRVEPHADAEGAAERKKRWESWNKANSETYQWPSSAETKIVTFDRSLVELVVQKDNAWFYAPVCGQGPHMFVARNSLRGTVAFE